LSEYLAKDYEIVLTPEMFKVIRDIVLKTSQEFSGQEAVQYSEWCEAFEKKE
jgi:hypothetical protein